mmetsp:Transcript_7912/g.22043  ORF Transcript_7912/g.22043 Transcript_7912/m.22043 type:complete len:394 (-) Transcript_7912:318-1499(-)
MTCGAPTLIGHERRLMRAPIAQIFRQNGKERYAFQQVRHATLVDVGNHKIAVHPLHKVQILGRQSARDKETAGGNPFDGGRSHFAPVRAHQNAHGASTQARCVALGFDGHDATLLVAGVQKFRVQLGVATFGKLVRQKFVHIGQPLAAHDAFDRYPALAGQFLRQIGKEFDFQIVQGWEFHVTAFAGETGIGTTTTTLVVVHRLRQVAFAQTRTGADAHFGSQRFVARVVKDSFHGIFRSVQLSDFVRLQGQTTVPLGDKIVDDEALDNARRQRCCGRAVILNEIPTNQHVLQIGQSNLIVRHDTGRGDASDNGHVREWWWVVVVALQRRHLVLTIIAKGFDDVVQKDAVVGQSGLRNVRGVAVGFHHQCWFGGLIQSVEGHATVGTTNVARE